MHSEYDEKRAGMHNRAIISDDPILKKCQANALDMIRQERENNEHCILPLAKMFEVWSCLLTACQGLTEHAERNNISRDKGWGDMEVGVQYR